MHFVRSPMLALGAASVFASACASTPTPKAMAETTPFFCRYQEPPSFLVESRRTSRVVDGEIGRLEIKVLPPDTAPAERETKHRGQSFLGDMGEKRISMVSENVPLGSVAVALAEALGFNVVVDPQAAPARVFIHAANIRVWTAVRFIAHQADVEVDWNDGLSFEARGMPEKAEYVDEQYIKIRIVNLPPTISSVEFAAAYCNTCASKYGSVAVVGQHAIVRDTLEALVNADGLALRLQGLPEPPTKDGDEEQAE